MLSRSIIALAIWCSAIGVMQHLVTLGHLAAIKPSSSSQLTDIGSQHAIAHPAANNVVQSVAHASILPAGPSGQLLPPGTVAPDRTYSNSYAGGQCTWYVASRRQIPSGWGNAAAWYYHAAGSGWSVGNTPAVAAVAWTSAGYYGHVALVEQVSATGNQVYISEMNYRGVWVKSYRWAPASQFKYIY
jgi:surface antigen